MVLMSTAGAAKDAGSRVQGTVTRECPLPSILDYLFSGSILILAAESVSPVRPGRWL